MPGCRTTEQVQDMPLPQQKVHSGRVSSFRTCGAELRRATLGAVLSCALLRWELKRVHDRAVRLHCRPPLAGRSHACQAHAHRVPCACGGCLLIGVSVPPPGRLHSSSLAQNGVWVSAFHKSGRVRATLGVCIPGCLHSSNLAHPRKYFSYLAHLGACIPQIWLDLGGCVPQIWVSALLNSLLCGGVL